ncbi:MAG: molybdopterin-guanine dinucleotide biosynthesis protein B [Synergistaceae bacterium]|nr:molybdopterin-guanine dinucleotide biosynthesis protein B [Synergistaceae bacterium]
MPVMIALSGFKNSGKTSLARALLTLFADKGLSVGYVKHTDKDVLSDRSTDSGSVTALGISALYWGADGLRKEIPGQLAVENLQSFFPGFDLVLVEGAKSVPLPRIWVGTLSSVPEEVAGIFAVYDRRASSGDGIFLFAPGEETVLADRVEKYITERGESPAELYVRGERIPLKPFIAQMLARTLAGIIGPLKGVNSLKEGADIFIKSLK